MKIAIFDFEVFRYDVLLGAMIIDEANISFMQTWDKDKMKRFYCANTDSIFIGHNCLTYDNGIYTAILNDVDDLYKFSKSLIHNNGFRKKYKLDMLTFDTMMQSFYSLKLSELSRGIKVHTTDVDFDLPRPLTEEEKRLTEEYNKDDLLQTYYNFCDILPKFELRLQLANEFNLNRASVNWTETQIASAVLDAKHIDGIETWYVKPEIYKQLQIDNKDVVDFYLTERFRQRQSLTTYICGCEHKLGAGGIHAAKTQVHYDKVMYFDVSGYYNLVMLNYDLLPRTLSEKFKELYKYMYYEQLRLKKIDPVKRKVYKVILLAVFGAMMNEYTDLYDPQRGSLVTITGQLFIVDLLEKLESLGEVVQSNTDGVMFVPFDWKDEEKCWDIVRAWEQRTGFTIEKEIIYNLWQRDVNNYVYTYKQNVQDCAQLVDRENAVHCRGEAVGYYSWNVDHVTIGKLWQMKEPKIICHCIVDYLIFNQLPEQTVERYKHDLRYFQYLCKRVSADYCKYEERDSETNDLLYEERVADNNRAFAKLNDGKKCKIVRCKIVNGQERQTNIGCLPDNIEVYNDSLLTEQAYNDLHDVIDYQYYVNRAYEKIIDFMKINNVKALQL